MPPAKPEDPAGAAEHQRAVNADATEGVKSRKAVHARQEKEWVRRSKSGDEEAFKRLFEHYFPKMYATAYHMTRNPSASEDLAQATMVQAWRRLKDFDGRSGFGTWLYRIGVNLVLDHLRRKKGREAPVDQARQEPEAEVRHPSAEVEKLEFTAALGSALGQLSETHRTTFVLAELQGLSYESIGALMRCKRGTVMSRMYYARLHLQKLLKPFYEPNR